MKHLALLGIVVLLVAGATAAFGQGQNGTTIDASKTAVVSWIVQTNTWTIDKTVDVASHNLFMGETGTSSYTVSVTETAGTPVATYGQGGTVTGFITVHNGGTVATQGLAITDAFVGKLSGKTWTTVAAATVDTSAMPELAPGQTYRYPYSVTVAAPQPIAGWTYKNTCKVTILNHSGDIGSPRGPAPDASPVATVVNDTIHVTDTNPAGPQHMEFATTGSTTYSVNFDTEGVYPNTATIDETGRSDDASVTVKVYELTVDKAWESASYTRTYDWKVTKSGVCANDDDASVTATYTITATATAVDGNFKAGGTITITNPNPERDAAVTVTDTPGDGVTLTVDPSGNVTVPANGSVSLPWEATTEDMATDFTNAVTVALPTWSWADDCTFGFCDVAPTEISKFADVLDQFAGEDAEVLGTADGAAGSTSFVITRSDTASVTPQ